MKLYHLTNGILIEGGSDYHLLPDENWDQYINDDNLLEKIGKSIQTATKINDPESLLRNELIAPIGHQELWASGVTYYNSKLGREEESKGAGGSNFYARVYEADRPELFFKASASRIVGPGGKVRIRKDSEWDVPEPELTLFCTSNGKIVGYTVGNDMSSRSIEGENPLYLPQAKTYDGCAALGPCILVTDAPLPEETEIQMDILRHRVPVYSGSVTIDLIRRKFTDLVAYLYRECSFPHGSFLMTGTGIVPSNDFTLEHNDEIRIRIDGIGTLINTVA